MDLTGCRKLYLMKKKIRIVYKIIEKELVVFIITIARRDKGEAYYIASERI
jgi:mRNA interferase RelE/StbE